jgi:cytochrome c-type biogenesis protein
MGGEISVFAAFIGGLISFISPCVLPLVPAYIAFTSGVSIHEMRNSRDRKKILKKTVKSSLIFILGFSLVFVSLGATATVLGQLVSSRLDLLSKIAGVIVIIFGLHLMGLFKFSFLNYEKKFHLSAKKGPQLLHSFLLGLAFAFGWTPCIGPILGTILFLAGGQDTIQKGVLLLSVYSLGLGLPFLLTAIGTSAFMDFFNKIKGYFTIIEIFSGVFLILVGFLIFTNQFTIIAGWLTQWFPWLLKLG